MSFWCLQKQKTEIEPEAEAGKISSQAILRNKETKKIVVYI